MSELRDDEVVLKMLEYAVEHECELSAGQGIAHPPREWSVEGVRVPPEQRKRATHAAHAEGLVDVTHIGNDPIATELTPKGRQFVQEWGGG